ncbi:MAG: hypothetical protein KF725_06915 [Cyclobacteriaceae bacterium]|nr:hypothetical protein [Cyclobacteriaceae bacterium]UYN88340.1 MAG: hypothetical protein KIT51_08895 [Cyclobacteriaceae bacterium]
MKVLLTTLIVLSIYFSALAQKKPIALADSTFFRAKLFKVNLLSPIAQTFSGAFESVLSPEKSIQVAVFINEVGFGVTPEYRYYLSSTSAPQGVYIAPFVRYQQLDGFDATFGGGLVIGKQNFYKKKISIDAYFGPSYNTFVFDEVFKFGIRAGIMIGLNVKSPNR